MSFRSKGDVNVNDYSRRYWQGGGHKNAAGGVSELTILEAIDKVKSTSKEIIIDD
jgi:phosphoesterase RecJ-like protein